MTRRLFTPAEDEAILKMRKEGISCLKIGRLLGRSSVKNRYRLLTIGQKPWQSPYPGCAALVRAQIATGQYSPAARQTWLERHATTPPASPISA